MAAPLQQFQQGTETVKPVDARQNIPSADADAFGGGAGRVLSQAGVAIDKTSDLMAKRAMLMATEDNEARAKAKDTVLNDTLRGMLFDPERGYFNKKGSDAVEAYKPTMEAAKKLVNETAAAIPEGEARRMFTDIANRRLDASLDSMSRHASIERRTYLDGVSIARADSSANDAVAYATDPAKREAALNVARSEIITFGRDHGEPAEVTQNKLRNMETKTYVGIVQRIAITDPEGAAKYYEEKRHQIDGQQQGPVESFLKVKTERYRSTADADAIMGRGTSSPYGDKVGLNENGGSYAGTPNKSTGASGRYQFIDAVGNAKRHAGDLVQGKSDADIALMMRSNTPEGRALQDKTFSGFTRANEAELTKVGVPINDSTRYMASWFGAAGATKILKADPNTPIETFLPTAKGADGQMRTPEQWAEANGVKGMTTGQVAALAQKRMGSGTTKLPDEGGIANAPTSADPKEKLRLIQENFADYIEKTKQIADPERRDHVVTELKRRLEIETLKETAAEKARQAQAWSIAVTPGPNGQRPTSQDAIPTEVWMLLDPKHQEALTRQFVHNAKGTEPPDNPGLYYALNREAQDDPDAFKARNLFLNKPELPNHRWDDLVKLQRSIVKGDAKEYKITEALRIASVPLKRAGFALGDAAPAKDKEVLGQFQAALQDWVTQFQEINKKPPQQADVLKQVDHMLIEGKIRGDGIFGSDLHWTAPKQVDGPPSQKGARGSKPGTTFNFQVAPNSRGSFYIPYDDIPADRRVLVEQRAIKDGLLKPRPAPDGSGQDGGYEFERRKVIEDNYGAYLAGGGK